MPIIKSARKRVKVARKAAIRNSKTKRTLKTALKNFEAAIKSGKKVNEAHDEAQSALDTAAKKNILHKNKVARKKAQLSAAAKTAGAKPTKKASSAKKPTTAKKAPAKKPATKKTAPKAKTTKK